MKNWQKLALTSFLVLTLVGCTRSVPKLERYVEPDWVSEDESNKVKVDIFTTSDILGNLLAEQKKISSKNPITVSYGGAELLLSYQNISKERQPKTTLWLDTGGIFDPLADEIHHQETLHFIRRMKFDALAFTQKELAILGNDIKKNFNIEFVNSHLIDLSTGRSFESDSIKPFKVITKNGVRIAVLAVTDFSLNKLQAPEKIRALYFEDMVLGILRAKKNFEKQKINAVILLAHVDSGCHSNNDERYICPQEGDELMTLLNRLPPKTIDLVIASPNRIASGNINNIPVLMAPERGQWLGRAQIIVSNNETQINVLSPIRVCNQFFHDTRDCHIPNRGEKNASDRLNILNESSSAMRPAKFWGHEISGDDKIKDELKAIRTQGTLSP